MQEIATHPKFAVVGHPNKGKSSIVASLSFDDSIQISDTPGTTKHKRSFPLKMDGEVLYEIYDTPGFQRPRRVLDWLESHDVSADKRPSIVRQFIEEHRDDERFRDEVELLEPIMDGSGIIFVVDGSKPYGAEYETQMEILRWTAQPSMALINHIDESDYQEEWRRALSQYFRLVRLYNPMKRTFTDHISLLEAIAQLKEQWRDPIYRAIDILQKDRVKKFEKSAKVIYELMKGALSYVKKISINSKEPSSIQQSDLVVGYENHIRDLEQKAQKDIENIWQHKYLKKNQDELDFFDMDLFSSQSESIFGLSKKELLAMGMLAGAATGASTDVLLAGSTMFLGSVLGGITGGVGAYLGFDKVSQTKVLGQRLGKRYLQIGPVKDRNFAYILLGRAIYHASSIIARSHAMRSEVTLKKEEGFSKIWLDKDNKNILQSVHKSFSKSKSVKKQQQELYITTIANILQELDIFDFS